MGRVIIKIKDKFLLWSSIVDAPVTYGMDVDQLRECLRLYYGELGAEMLPRYLETIDRCGTSSDILETVEDIIADNRAGPDETPLTLDEIYQKYCVEAGPR